MSLEPLPTKNPQVTRVFVRTRLVQANVANRRSVDPKKDRRKIPLLTREHFKAILSTLKNSCDGYTNVTGQHKQKHIKAISLMLVLKRIGNLIGKKKTN
ncbi:MAG: hypothetical protein ACD_62C00215G0005 [uncultured bacterium]|nr:MAG: hypothetical protein ACD_62C00215G0005 [uncultured bacterium]